ncbi:hypothetical protein ACE193_00385 [Bernardetia sp. OM2101]|uniref:hypothetical protein n=1 Tax=Bernardetia sp. OM2101 TaxID=3344876 RepID=UPI0035CF6D41
MQKIVKVISIIFFVFYLHSAFGQTNLVTPRKGVEGVPIVIDSSKISNVIEIYGTDYKLLEHTLVTTYVFDKIGLAFQIDPYDKNQIVRSISIELPFEAKTKNGIVLGKSTMKDVWTKYGDKGCFTSESDAHHSQSGISFYIRKDSNDEGYDASKKIYKIEINNDGRYGDFSRVNFEFNYKPVQKKIDTLISILKLEEFDFERLGQFWSEEKVTEKKPYGLEKQIVFNRQIEKSLVQENIEIRLVGHSYELNIITLNNNLAYLKLIQNKDQKTLVERIENSQLENSDLDTYIYGTFCGIGGSPPKKCQEMLELVQEKKYTKLADWLKSINPEISTYGYIGLDFLNKNGVKIKQNEVKQMNELRKSEIQLNTCQGCTIGITEKIKDILTEKNLGQMYESFKKTGWLR